MEEKIYLNQNGYDDYLKKIEQKEKELADLRIYKGTEAIYQGDTWHDNPTLYQTELKENALMMEISKMKKQLNNIEIVENSGDSKLIDFGDIIKIYIYFSDNDYEEEIFKLVGTTPDLKSNVQEISINSPLGKSIYHKKIGDVGNYKVEEKEIKFKIVEKLN